SKRDWSSDVCSSDLGSKTGGVVDGNRGFANGFGPLCGQGLELIRGLVANDYFDEFGGWDRVEEVQATKILWALQLLGQTINGHRRRVCRQVGVLGEVSFNRLQGGDFQVEVLRDCFNNQTSLGECRLIGGHRQLCFVFGGGAGDFAAFYGSGNIAQHALACRRCGVIVLFNDNDLGSGCQKSVGYAGAHASAA